MLEQLRSLVPVAVTRPVRHVLDIADSAKRLHTLERCVTALRHQVRVGLVTPQLLAQLRAAWGQESSAADVSFLAAVADRALTSRGPFLDCGSGLSTIVAGVIAGHEGGRVWSLEQDGAWARHMIRLLERLGVETVALWYAPLTVDGDCAWYDVRRQALPPEFTHIFCDGPSVVVDAWPDAIHASWRAGVVPVLMDRGVEFGEILLDDAEDSRCPELCRRWQGLGVATRIVSTPTGSYVLGRPASAISRSAPPETLAWSP